jgi:four helix bundle protein
LSNFQRKGDGTQGARPLRMSDIISYQDLVCWQKAIDLALLVYRITEKYPDHERYGLTSHTRKTAVAIPSNIAEGTRHKKPGYISRITISLGEQAELETQMIIGDRLGYVSEADMLRFETISTSVGQLTHGLLHSLDTGSSP